MGRKVIAMPKKNTVTLHNDVVYLEKFPYVNKYTGITEYRTKISPANELNEYAKAFLKKRANIHDSRTQYAYWDKKQTAYICKYSLGQVAHDLREFNEALANRLHALSEFKAFRICRTESKLDELRQEVKEAILENMSVADRLAYLCDDDAKANAHDREYVSDGEIFQYTEDEIEYDL